MDLRLDQLHRGQLSPETLDEVTTVSMDTKSPVEESDVLLAVKGRVEHVFTSVPPREVLSTESAWHARFSDFAKCA